MKVISDNNSNFPSNFKCTDVINSHLLSRYALPLFFLCVQTNFQYIVVAVFIPENEDMDSLIEVLQHFKAENPDWKPRNMMVDMSAAEIGAIESCFPGRLVTKAVPDLLRLLSQ